MKIKLICIRIDNNELKTTDKKEWLKFIKSHRGKVKSIEQFNWEIPENKLQKALEYSFDELYKFKQKENRGEQIDKTRVIRNTAVCKYIVGK